MDATAVRDRDVRDRVRDREVPELDVRRLAAELAGAIRGEVRFSEGSRALYATDASNYRQVPIGVVLPRDPEDLVAAVAICAEHGAPILPRGGGTALAGQACNVAVVLDCSRHLHEIVALDPERRTARVQPGVVLDDLRAAAQRHGLTFGPDPATHDHCTPGGMIANNSCGVHSIMSGRTVENVHELDVLLYDGTHLRVGAVGDDPALDRIVAAGGRRGELYGRLRALRDRYGDLVRARYPDIPRRVSGYNLDELLPERGFHVARALVGSEGTCVTVLEATLRLVASPPARCTLALGFADGGAAAEPVCEILEHGPTGIEGFDDLLLEQVRKKGLEFANTDRLPDGAGWLMVEFGGQEMAEAKDRARGLMDALATNAGETPSMRLLEGEDAVPVWSIRESGLGGTARVPGERPTWPGWEDAAVPPARLAEYLRALRRLCDRHGYRCALYGHYGQGCVHTRIDFELTTVAGIANWRSFLEQGADLVVSYGGSLSGEHGDGQARAELLPRMFGPELVGAFAEFKAIWDPAGRMNPGKVSDPAPLDANLRLGSGYRPAQPKTHFSFAADEGSLANATLRCVGVGKCRRHEGGTMCPSYMPGDEDAKRLRAQSFTLAELLERHTPGWRAPRLERRALHHGHCHHEAIMHTDADQALLARVGIDLERPQAGCCGMAGAFGFEADHYDVAVAVGERKLLPTIRQTQTPPDTLILADGFSCREQIRQRTGRRSLHLAEVLQLALHADASIDRA